MEQIDMFQDIMTTPSPEAMSFTNIEKILIATERTEMKLEKNVTSSYLAINFKDKNADFRVKFGKKSSYLAIKQIFANTMREHNYEFKPESQNSNWIRITISSPEDIFLYEKIINYIYDYRLVENSADSFDCCSRYAECSDKKECCQPDKDLARMCKYKLKLLQNIIFFGDNRNVD